ncbi:Fanconi anemia group A protein [Discoglossus pictus]
MSSVTDSAPGEQKRSLAELLAGRVKRPDRKPEDNRSKLQEAALYLLSCNQDPGDFLSEVEAPPYKKQCVVGNSGSSKTPTESSFTASFIGAVLRDQASHLGLPAGVLAAKAAACSIQQICQSPVESKGVAVLSEVQRDKLSHLLKALKGLLAANSFSRLLFSKELWKAQRPLVLEAVWHLHNEEMMRLELLLESTDQSTAVDWFCNEIQILCLHMENASAGPELPQRMISDFLIVLVENGFCKSSDTGKKSEQTKIVEISLIILDKMLSWLLSAVFEGKCEQSYKAPVQRHWLVAFDVSRYRIHVNQESLENFFVHTLNHVLTYMPKLKVSDAIRFQRNWSFVKTCPLLTDLYRKLFVAFSAEKLTTHIQLVLETQEVNWHHVLTCVSCLVICQSEAQQLVKDLLTRLLTQAFERYELECLITAFLIARQAALEGPAAFVPYTEWFKCTFGNASAYHTTSKKSLVFLLKFLSDLVPFEAAQYLKVHILHPPFVPTKYRSLLMEYISLAKTRLADMKVSIEDMGLYEDLSAAPGTDEPQSQAKQDVDKAIHIFENTGKIPASVMEASIFRRPYFTSRFLPALLAPRVLPAVPDSHMLLIDSLKRADKIPANIHSAYLVSCEQESHRSLARTQMTNPVLQEEPLGRMRSALCDLRSLVIDTTKYDEVSAQMAVVSDRLSAAIGCGKGAETLVIPESLIPPLMLELLDHTVADLVLTNFCQCVMAASCANPPDRQGPWPSLYVKMLCGHLRTMSAILKRILQLLFHQAAHLSDSHVIGLAAFSIHLHECRRMLPSSQSLERFWEVLLSPQSSDAMSVCLRFCTAAVSYALCRFSPLSSDASPECLPPLFMRKLQHLLPRLVWEIRDAVVKDEEMDTLLPCPSKDWKEAALTLWRQSYLQDLLKKQSFQLSFRDWLLYEMSLNPGSDALCDTERQDYQRWAVNLHYLPESSAAGGCENVEKACTEMVDAVLEFCSRCMPNRSSKQKGFLSHRQTGLADILCRLQELVLDLMASRHPSSDHVSRSPFLFQVFRQRLSGIAGQSEMGFRLAKQGEVAACCRIMLGLPPSLLCTTRCARGVMSLSADNFFKFVNEELKNIGPRGCALPYHITVHFFRGVLNCSSQLDDPVEGINSILEASHSVCPIILTSAALWWPQIDPILGCQWERLFGGDLPVGFEALRILQAAVDSCFSGRSSLPPSSTPWLLAAFVYFTMRRRKMAHGEISKFLSTLDTNAEQLLISLLFFSIMELIPESLKEEGEHKMAAETCILILHSLEERGGSWVSVFQLIDGRKSELCLILHRTASEHFLNLLPFAFYKLIPHLEVDRVVKQQNFLAVAVQMYNKLLQLFLDGNLTTESPLNSQQLDCQDFLTRARPFLLRCIPKCPKPNNALMNQLVESCGHYDPEVSAVIQSSFQASQDEDLYKEPDLF